MRLVFAATLAAALTLFGCDCGNGPTQQGGGELVVDSQLEFPLACPTPADPTFVVEQVSRPLRLRNDGNATLYINQFEVEPAMAQVFVVDPAAVPASLGAGEVADVPIAFRPAANSAGSTIANLTIKAEGDPITVKLLGEVRNLPSIPGMSLSCPGGQFDTDFCKASTPNVFFKNTPVFSSGEMTITVSNGGCPLLKLTQLVVTTDTTDGAAENTFALSDGQPAAVDVGPSGPAEIKLTFKPKISGTQYGALTFKTNDPAQPNVTVELKGVGELPLIEIETAKGCGYPDLSADPRCCDFKPKNDFCTGLFTVKNVGDHELTISAVRLKNNDSMFAITRAPAAGTTIPSFQELADAIEITYSPEIQKRSDTLIVESSAGTAEAELRGGSPPWLEVFPVGTLDFGSNLSNTTDVYQSINVVNLPKYNKQLPLHLGEAVLTQSLNVFSISPTVSGDCRSDLPLIAAGGTLESGFTGAQLCLKFAPGGRGGDFVADLRLRTDDPNYPAPNDYLLTMGASTQCNPAPYAEITAPLTPEVACTDDAGCSGTAVPSKCVDNICQATTNFTATLTGTKTVTLSGGASFDYTPDSVTHQCTVENHAGIARYEWTLLAKPPTSTASSLNPTAAPGPKFVQLEYDKAGPYLIRLFVYDATGLKSANADFTVTVTGQ